MQTILKPYVKDLQLSDDLENDIHMFFSSHNDLETLNHSITVANEAERVARLYGADTDKAKQAGLLHDISNVIPASEMLVLAKQLSIELLDDEYKYGPIVH